MHDGFNLYCRYMYQYSSPIFDFIIALYATDSVQKIVK